MNWNQTLITLVVIGTDFDSMKNASSADFKRIANPFCNEVRWVNNDDWEVFNILSNQEIVWESVGIYVDIFTICIWVVMVAIIW
jgi:hypothetical protein